MALLPRRYFERYVEEVARGLVGVEIHLGGVTLRITETEAYGGPEDSASHARFGHTERNAPMWGPAGCVYVYLCYGIHNMLNFVTGPRGAAGAVLIRSCEPIEGIELIRERRGERAGTELLAGPGRVGEALGLDVGWSHHDACAGGGLEVHEGEPPKRLFVGSRVGVNFAEKHDRDKQRRFADGATTWISQSNGLIEGP
ncbi:MAG: 3-methyladenine DNA glycosylase [Gemmatimonadetes bacterium]|nr:3-methyladenine DNA glycosylase [Gemmatimonadota bacterium]